MIKICFVCLGNICRSPMAEAVMIDEIKKRGWEDKIKVTSAATSDWEDGNPIHKGTVSILKSYGISVPKHTSIQLAKLNNQDFDFIIGMDNQNILDITRIVGDMGNVYRLLDFTDQGGEIADPWYTDDFETTYRDVKCGVRGLCRYIENRELGQIRQ